MRFMYVEAQTCQLITFTAVWNSTVGIIWVVSRFLLLQTRPIRIPFKGTDPRVWLLWFKSWLPSSTLCDL